MACYYNKPERFLIFTLQFGRDLLHRTRPRRRPYHFAASLHQLIPSCKGLRSTIAWYVASTCWEDVTCIACGYNRHADKCVG